MARLFGTDGVRGLANRDVTAELALDLAVGAAHVLALRGEFRKPRPRAIVGRDPRASGEFLSAAVAAGLASAGVDVVDVGVVPTPAVAFLTGRLGGDLGVMISASHNPMQDNGIKFFDRNGYKLDDDVEDQIAALMGENWERPVGAKVGRIRYDYSAVDAYVDALVDTVTYSLEGLRVVVDCAHGAASVVGPLALERAGAEVIVIGNEPDGENINHEYGATAPRRMAAATVGHSADVGVSFDGDADRCIASDEEGIIVDGDKIMGMLAIGAAEAGRLKDNVLVTTVMSNLGLRLAMEERGISTVQTSVGDRYVLEEMLRHGYTIGGEQSGHVLLTEFSTTGDGILTALHLLSRLAERRVKMSELAGAITQLPQVMINVKDVDKAAARTHEGVLAAVAAEEAALGDTGRVLLRASGTEPLVRVMVEAPTQELAQGCAQRLADVVREHLALSS
ncbi:phosphoglucosamine mutase [Jonesia denitrificans]|uniref:Phosphoglucosamine mutase n=1 Tax=Jonesia denitrificans (strain ATCC 14870 / DSM 20603 / BCRC 15368 / CIP 55.134 / JCM 11481 / NBRC 15587 / NCTC 10816 / Prevot 55134) TaxID=471856 RepID=C7R168_JONDD|nr:phosphoglucosamine mutase [Jonesia denitrificans]ACV08283.1 phosphoglucosamine mutase [Jonesia denitrificans DSM 20603]ASE08048.1 phosphoglucosamine mutase [Jonesia denitrificans]QXB42653.1 phosphoglucosamine mutase [Jonesia denitrificans]SQH20264.1 Phosphoglucosamine mutase [Jonesia denitrificans]